MTRIATPMKCSTNVLLLFLMVASALSYAQQTTGGITGQVLDRDGKTPVMGATVWVDQLSTMAGQITIRQRFELKTRADGRYSISDIYLRHNSVSRMQVSIVRDKGVVMVQGDLPDNEISLRRGEDLVVNFDLSKAPPRK